MITFDKFFKATSPATFELPWHLKLIGHYLEQVERGQIQNLAVFTPPQHGKSTTVAERYPAFHFSRDPLSHVLLCSYSDDLAVRASTNCRTIVQSDWWQEKFAFPVGKATEARWQFAVPGQDGRYSCVASGIAGGITGHTADLVVIDDVLRNRMDALSATIRENIWQNFTSSVESRLPKTGRIVMITTRWHADDLPGRILTRAKDNKKASQWTVLVLPATNDSGEEAYVLDTRTGERKFIPTYDALWPSRFPREVLDQRRADLGESIWSALYACRPSMGIDQLFPPESWGTYDSVSSDELALIVSSWDCASKTGAGNDFSANVVLGKTNDGRLLVLDVWKSKVEFSHLPGIILQRYQDLAARYQNIPVLCIEDANSGTQAIQLFQSSHPEIPLVVSKPLKSKLIRAEGVTVLTRAGTVCLPSRSVWRDMFVNECAEFPLGQNDDVVDAFAQGAKVYVGSGDFKKPEFLLTPGKLPGPKNADEELIQAMQDAMELEFPEFGVY